MVDDDLRRAASRLGPAAPSRSANEHDRGGVGTLTDMTERITAREFHQAEGVEDWRVLGAGVCAYFRTRTFATGLRLVNVIGELAEEADHHPDIDLRYRSVTVRLISHDIHALSHRDVRMARRISMAARELGVPADPARVQDIGLTIEALVGPEVLPFWRAALAYRQVGDEDLLDPHWRWPSIRFRPSDSENPRSGRIQVDVVVGHDQAETRVAAAVEAGGHLVSDAQAPSTWTLADAEGNEVNIVTRVDPD